MAAVSVRFLLGAGDRVLYSVMPLYHSSGGQIGTAVSLVFGNKTVIKAKFSARNFFKDCAKYKATVREITKATALEKVFKSVCGIFQGANFIGEICRYLLATPPSPIDKQGCESLELRDGHSQNMVNHLLW